MILESEVNILDKRFYTRSQIFEGTDIILVNKDADSWMIKYRNNKYYLLHQNIHGNRSRYHSQGKWKAKLIHCYDAICTHKGHSSHTYSLVK